MSNNPKPPHHNDNKIVQFRPSGYYWRLLARGLNDQQKLLEVLELLCEELTVHRQQCKKLNIWPEKLHHSGEFIAPKKGCHVPALKEMLEVLVLDLEAFRRCFRQNKHWPPLVFEASEVARTYLGYDPDAARRVCSCSCDCGSD